MKLRTAGAALAAFFVFSSISPAEAGELQGRIAEATAAKPAVVWVEGIESGPVPARDTVVTYGKAGLQPFVSIGFVGGSFVLRNEDDELHNTHFYLRLAYQKEVSQRPLEYGATLFNVALPRAGTEVRKPIRAHHRYRDDTGYIEVACNRHPKERAYILVFDHPYAAVTGTDGTFSIPDLPPGSYAVRIWHGGTVTKKDAVEIGKDSPTRLDIDAG